MDPPLCLSQANAVALGLSQALIFLIFLQAPGACDGWSVRINDLMDLSFFFLSFTKHNFKPTITRRFSLFSVTRGWGQCFGVQRQPNSSGFIVSVCGMGHTCSPFPRFPHLQLLWVGRVGRCTRLLLGAIPFIYYCFPAPLPAFRVALR